MKDGAITYLKIWGIEIFDLNAPPIPSKNSFMLMLLTLAGGPEHSLQSFVHSKKIVAEKIPNQISHFVKICVYI